MKKFGNEFKVGIFFIICCLGLFYMTVSTGKMNIVQEGYNIYVTFNEVAGLETKAPVMLNGFEVGKVEDMEVQYGEGSIKVRLKLWLAKESKVYEEAVISIKTLGLMGEKFIQISSSSGDKFLEPGAIIEGKPYMDLDVLMEEAQGVTENIDVLVTNVNALTDEVKKLTVNLNDTVEGNQDKISRIIDNIEVTTVNMEEMSEDIKSHPWKLLYKDKETRVNREIRK